MKRNLIAIGITVFLVMGLHLCIPSQTQAQSATFTLVKTIIIGPLIGGSQNNEVDVVGNELYVQNWASNLYFRIDPLTSTFLGSFSLSTLDHVILMDNHGSDYNPNTGTIYHVSDDDHGVWPFYDAFFETDTAGNVVRGPYDLFGPGDNSEDPEGLAVDPFTGRVWVSSSGNDGIYEIDPSDATILNQVYVGFTNQLAFNPINGKLVFDANGQLWEIAPDGTGLEMVNIPGTSVSGMAFTPTGDLVLLSSDRLFLYDSTDDADDVFTTAKPISIDIKPNADPNTIILTSKGTISVGILTTADFNANRVDPTTVLFADASPIRRKMVDVDRDGDIDMLLSFNIQELNLDINSTIATLTGTMDDVMGTLPIRGTDSVTIITKGKK